MQRGTLVLVMAIGALFSEASLAAKSSYEDDLLFSNVMIAITLDNCGDTEKSLNLKNATVNLIQVKWTAEGKKGSIIESASKRFDFLASYYAEYLFAGNYKTPRKECEIYPSAFSRTMLEMRKRSLYFAKRVKKKNQSIPLLPCVGDCPPMEDASADCGLSAQDYQDAYERNGRVSDLVCMKRALVRELK